MKPRCNIMTKSFPIRNFSEISRFWRFWAYLEAFFGYLQFLCFQIYELKVSLSISNRPKFRCMQEYIPLLLQWYFIYLEKEKWFFPKKLRNVTPPLLCLQQKQSEDCHNCKSILAPKAQRSVCAAARQKLRTFWWSHNKK